ncbi:hypothetical protein BDN72DRAFT_833088 [Pluteus cervinus]|uniref:Uncharacterized protein n=1 Tax=Pluteus cervinus TaxID=181527 RepID=A0ACD3BAH5_9AGAR|nr:hypothetical protein BDN72DRAFT_833088 [Pluteus cervinus]
MFARFARLPLRRCLHTSASGAVHQTRFNRYGLVLTVGAATSYLAWRLNSDAHRIALDSNPSSSRPSTTTPSKDKFSHPETPSSTKDSSESSEPSQPETSHDSTEASEPIKDTKEGEEGEEPSSEEHGGGGAYNPVTGEINWDCPCLGGMAHGPCGEEFKEAFSCFVHSEQEPKGIDCIEKFKGMQNCFKEHPEHYASELEGDEEEDEVAPAEPGSEKNSELSDHDVSDSSEVPQASSTDEHGLKKPKQKGSLESAPSPASAHT